MKKEFILTFNYLSDESIKVDKSEFLFQVKSHPDHPSLLSISDTLSFLGVENGSMNIKKSDIAHLPDRFISFMKQGGDNKYLYYVKRSKNGYSLFDGDQTLTLSDSEFESKWLGVVFLIEDSDRAIDKPERNWLIPLAGLISVTLLGVLLFTLNLPINSYIFLLLTGFGIALSLMAMKKLFGGEPIQLIEKFCKQTKFTDCEAVTNSKKWLFFKYLDFGDIGLVFFASQLLTFVIMAFAGEIVDFLTIQKWMLYIGLFVISLSIYYQKFVENKWCTICLSISMVILVQTAYTTFYLDLGALSTISTRSVLVFLLVGFTGLAIWGLAKTSLNHLRSLQQFQLNANRYLRAYEPFRLSLLSQKVVELPDTPVIVGSKSKLIITVITNPFCGNCQEVHTAIERVLSRYPNDLQVKTIFKISLALDSPDIRRFHRVLMTVYLKKGPKEYTQALNKFFKHGDVKRWNDHYEDIEVNESEIDQIYNFQNDWCNEKGISFTPLIFINNYPYPKGFDINSLEFYIEELLDDETICPSNLDSPGE